MSETEDPFILLEPSCDIHLVAGGTFPDDRRAVPFRILRGVWNPTEGRHDLTALTADIHFDAFAFGTEDPASVVTIEPPDAQGRGRLVPHAPGTLLVQIRYLDPARPDKYDSLIARIRVHDVMDGWWFGHELADLADPNSPPATSVFKDAALAHTQPTVLAVFDQRGRDTGGVVGDITGHGYVRLTSEDPAICAVDPVHAGRLRGVEVGDTRVIGELPLPFPEVPAQQPLAVRVIDLHRLPDSALEQVKVDLAADPRSKANMVFLAEGFTDAEADRQSFDQVVKRVVAELFSKPRHEPFHLLAGHFNVWSRYEPSRHRGITIGPELHDDSSAPGTSGISMIPETRGVSGADEPLEELVKQVGLPEPDETRTVAELRAEWSKLGSVPRLVGYFDPNVTDQTIESWKRLRSLGVPAALDTTYGLHLRVRLGDRLSVERSRGVMRVRPPGGPADLPGWTLFVSELHNWFTFEGARTMSCDPRRYAPEYRRAASRLLVRYAGRLGDARPGSRFPTVGQLWDPRATVESPAGARHLSSAGLVCILVNANQNAGNAELGLGVYVMLGSDGDFPNAVPLPGRRRLLFPGAEAPYAIDQANVTDVVAHELGHSHFQLGDEYEERRGLGGSELFDNLTSDVVNPSSPDFPTPIHTDRIKWARLHRMAQADTVVRPTEIEEVEEPGTGRRIIVTVAPGRAARWQKALEAGTSVYLRRWNMDRGRQLPIGPDDLYEGLTIEMFSDDTLVLFPAEGTQPVSFPPGSVLYIPKLDPDTGFPVALVSKRVLDYMRTESYDPDDPSFPPGVSLSENHKRGDPSRSDPPEDSRDVPPSIPGYVAPCQPHRVLGLYEGGDHFTRAVYRPAGACKMRSHEATAEGEFCFVCKYLQVNLVDPALHPELDEQYPRPSWWKRFWKGGES